MAELLTWTSGAPSLRRPVLIVALEGFVDAGAVASTASMFLRHRWRSDLVARFDRETFIDYRARRPTAVVDSGVLRRVEWPAIELYAAVGLDGPHDALLLLGPEPDMRWSAFFDAVHDACKRTGVEFVLGLGAYPAATPHTRPIRIMKAGNAADGSPAIAAGEIPGYTGPIGAGSALQAALAEHGLPAVGLWAEIPHYISGSPNPAGALAMVRKVSQVLDTEVDTTELEAAAKLHAEQVDEALAEYDEAAEMVAALEEHVDAGDDEEALPSGEDIAAEIERFLKNQQEG